MPEFYKSDHFYFETRNGREFPCFKMPSPHCMGSDKGLHHPQLKTTTLDILRRQFQPMVEQFFKLTGVKLELWKIYNSNHLNNIYFCFKWKHSKNSFEQINSIKCNFSRTRLSSYICMSKMQFQHPNNSFLTFSH